MGFKLQFKLSDEHVRGNKNGFSSFKPDTSYNPTPLHKLQHVRLIVAGSCRPQVLYFFQVLFRLCSLNAHLGRTLGADAFVRFPGRGTPGRLRWIGKKISGYDLKMTTF